MILDEENKEKKEYNVIVIDKLSKDNNIQKKKTCFYCQLMKKNLFNVKNVTIIFMKVV